MKKLLILTLLFASVNCFAQSKEVHKQVLKDTIQYRDSFPPVADSIKIMDQKQIVTAYKYLQDNMTATKYSELQSGIDLAFRVLYEMAVQEYRRTQKPIKVKMIKP